MWWSKSFHSLFVAAISLGLSLSVAVPSFADRSSDNVIEIISDSPPRYDCRYALRGPEAGFPSRTDLLLPEGWEDWETSGSFRQLRDIQELRVFDANTLNVYAFVGKHAIDPDDLMTYRPHPTKGRGTPKPEKFVKWLAREIQRSGADIVNLQEVENGFLNQIDEDKYGLVLAKLVAEELGDEYMVIETRGNDGRGIQTGWLVKKDLPFFWEVETFTASTWEDRAKRDRLRPLFSRDSAVLHFGLLRDVRSRSKKRLGHLMNLHMKSMRDRGGDRNSQMLAGAQAEGSALILQTIATRYGSGQAPLIVAGDLNRHHNTGGTPSDHRVLDPFYDGTGMIDALDIEQDGNDEWGFVPSHYWWNRGRAKFSRLDGIQVSSALEGMVLFARVTPWTDEQGEPLDPPRDKDERKQRPSDHEPLQLHLDFQALLGLYERNRGR